jgi:hypothetical protein
MEAKSHQRFGILRVRGRLAAGLLLVLCLMAGWRAGAAPVSAERAGQAAARWIWERTVAPAQPLAHEVALPAALGANGAYRVFAFEPEGYVVVAADDVSYPVIAYSTTGRFDPDHLAPAFAMMLSNVRDEIRAAAQGGQVALARAQAEWARVGAADFRRAGATAGSAVAPLLKTSWNQEPYYNNECPVNGHGHAAVGCTAVAFGQVMKFYAFPNEGTGQILGYTDPDYPYPMDADFGNTVYNWSDMPTSLTIYNKDSTGCAEIARLLLHVGVAAHMDYGPESGAFVTDALSGMQTYFGYDSGASEWSRTWYFGDWTGDLRTELENGRPVIYEGHGPDPETGKPCGHTFVLDGYDISGLFHVNWGWGGVDNNNYFNLDDLTPESYSFDDSQAAVFGFRPEHGSGEISLDHAYMTPATTGYPEVANPAAGEPIYFHAQYSWDGYSEIQRCGFRLLIDGANVYQTDSHFFSGSQWGGVTAGPFALQPGDHTYTWQADFRNQLDESDETDNDITASFHVAPAGQAGDLVLRRVYVSYDASGAPETLIPRIGDPLYFFAEIVSGMAATPCVARFELDGSLMSETAYPLGAYTTTTLCLGSWTAVAGAHSWTCTLDPDGALAESSTANNTAVQELVPSCGDGDMTAYDPLISTTDDGYNPVTDVIEGTLVYFQCHYEYTGSDDMPLCVAKFSVDGVTVWDFKTRADAYTDYRLWGGWRATPGQHTLRYELDASHVLVDGDTAARTVEATISVTPKPRGDLVLHRVFLSTRPTGSPEIVTPFAGENAYVFAEYSFTGTEDVPNCECQFLLDYATFGDATFDVSAGASHALVCAPTVLTLATGAHTLQVSLNSNGAVADPDPANNTLAPTFNVSEGNLTVHRAFLAYFSGNGSMTETTDPLVGEGVSLCMEYSFVGMSPVSNCAFRLVDPLGSADTVLVNLQPGDSHKVLRSPNEWVAEPGAWSFTWYGDDNDGIYESNEDDNGGGLAFTASTPVTYPTLGAHLTAGSRCVITWDPARFVGKRLRMELCQNDVYVCTIKARTNNRGSLKWKVPKKLAPGGGYRVNIYTPTTYETDFVSGSCVIDPPPPKSDASSGLSPDPDLDTERTPVSQEQEMDR